MAKAMILPVQVCRFVESKCVEVIEADRLVWKKGKREYTRWISKQYEVLTVNGVRMIQVNDEPPLEQQVLERILINCE